MNEETNQSPVTELQQEIDKRFENENLVKEAMDKDYEFYHNLVQPQQLDETGEKWGVRIGGRLVSDDVFETEDQAKDYIERKPWKIYFSMMCAVTEMVLNQKKYEKGNIQH